MSDKSVFVLDVKPCLFKASDISIDLETVNKSRNSGLIPLAPVLKPLWTCTVEGVMEYCRIIWDVFEYEKLIHAMVVKNGVGESLNSWLTVDQNCEQLLSGFASIAKSPKPGKKERDIFPALKDAVESLYEPSEYQLSKMNGSSSKTPNPCRIILITSLKGDDEIAEVEKQLNKYIVTFNDRAQSDDDMLPVTSCELYLVNVTTTKKKNAVAVKNDAKEISALLTSYVMVVYCGSQINDMMVEMVQKHHSLASTTISNIPMKEEQSSGGSLNYDVEVLHIKGAHEFLQRCGIYQHALTSKPSRDTIKLRWNMPSKANEEDMSHCVYSCRISPVNVNSRQSVCLTKFIMDGRIVLLDSPSGKSTKPSVPLYTLCGHGGAIYLHVFNRARTGVEDPPSISEGCGGRVTDYRIQDFSFFVKANRLAPVTDWNNESPSPLQEARKQIDRLTKFWPMTFSESLIINLVPMLTPILEFAPELSMSDDDLVECKKCIYHLIDMETKNEGLPIPSGIRSKATKREDQYRQVWSELEKYIRAHSPNSSQHQQLLQCLMDCKQANDIASNDSSSTLLTEGGGLDDVELALADVDRLQRMSEKERQEFIQSTSNFVAGSVDEEAVSPKKKAKLQPPPEASMDYGELSLFDIWESKCSRKDWREFYGRIVAKSEKAELYPHLHGENQQ